jgi:hypothetical protein
LENTGLGVLEKVAIKLLHRTSPLLHLPQVGQATRPLSTGHMMENPLFTGAAAAM